MLAWAKAVPCCCYFGSQSVNDDGRRSIKPIFLLHEMPSGLPFIPWTLRFPHDGANLGCETRACVGETCCVWKCPRHPFADLRDVMRPWDWGEFSCAGPPWPLPQPSIITLTQRHWPADWRLRRWLRWSCRRGLAEMGSAGSAMGARLRTAASSISERSKTKFYLSAVA